MLIGLGGDTMLGRKVAERIREEGPNGLFGPGVLEAAREADVFVCNLECCISDRGERWPDPRKPFFFRAPPAAIDTLHELGVDAVTLANNHALDYGPGALLDTVDLLDEAGIAHVGAGADRGTAWEPTVLDVAGRRVGVVGFTDHPADFAAEDDRPGTAYAPLRDGLPDRARATIDGLDADVVLVTPHWGPNMTTAPVGHVRRTAEQLATTRATLVAGHSAHAFHGVGRVGERGHGDPALTVLFDLGDLIDDYAVDPVARNDLGLLSFVELDDGELGDVEVREVTALPLVLEYRHTRVATGDAFTEVEQLLAERCRTVGSAVERSDGRLRVRFPD